MAWFKWGAPPPHPVNSLPNVGGTELPLTLATEPLIGYRTWLVRNGLNGLCLTSIFVNYEWTAADNQAYCDGHGSFGRTHNDPAPSPGCSCGLYINLPDMGFSEWNSLVARKVHATGQAAMSGRIIRCEKGYKAGAASILSPLLIETPCRVSGCSNGVTGVIIPTRSQLTFEGVCDDHAALLKEALLVKADKWIREVRRVLSDKYPGVEFLSFIG